MKKLFFLIIVIGLSLGAYSQSEQRSDHKPRVHDKNMPSFRGGDIEDFRVYVQKTVKYPEEAVKEGVSGTVYVGFDINRHGKVTNVKIVRSVEPCLDEAVLKVVKESPDWKHNGRRRLVSFTIPVNFILK